MKSILTLLFTSFSFFFNLFFPLNVNESALMDDVCAGPNIQYRLKFEHSDKYLQVANSGTTAGSNIEQSRLGDSNSQLFHFEYQSDGAYRIINTATGLSIGEAESGSNIELQNIGNNEAQLYSFYALANGSYHVVNAHSNLAFNLTGGSRADGANVVPWRVSDSQSNDNLILEVVNGACSNVQCEIKVNANPWTTLDDCSMRVNTGDDLVLSMSPNGIPIEWTLPNGDRRTTENLSLTEVNVTHTGWYYAELEVNGILTGKTIYVEVAPSNDDIGVIRSYNTGKAVSGCAMHDGYLFVPLGADHGGGKGSGAFAFYDITDPGNLVNVFDSRDFPNTYQNPNSPEYVGDWAEAHSLPVINDGNRFVMSERRDTSAGFSIFDVTGFPNANPKTISRFSFPGVTAPGNYDGYSFSLACKGSNYVFAPTGNNGLFIVDISDATNPRLVKHMLKADLDNRTLRSAVVIGDLLILTNGAVNGTSPIVFLDIKDPSNTSIISVSQPLRSGYQPFIYGSEFFTGNDGDIIGYDFSDPTNLKATTYNTNAGNVLFKPEYGFGQDGEVFIGHYPGLTKWSLGLTDLNAGPMVVAEPTNPVSDDYAFLTPIGNLAVVASDHNHTNKLSIARHELGDDLTPPEVKYILPHDLSVSQDLSTSIGIFFTDFIDPLTMNTENFQLINTTTEAVVNGSFNQLFGVVNFDPTNDLSPNTTYHVKLIANGIKDWRGNGIPEDKIVCTFSTGNTVDATEPFTINPTQPQAVSQTIDFSISHLVSVQYTWDFGDGSDPVTTNSKDVAHQYTAPGNYSIKVTASYPNGEKLTLTAIQVVHHTLLTQKPVNSSSIIFDDLSNSVWNVNPDNNMVSVINASTDAMKYRIPVGNDPQTLASVDDQVWVTNRKDATISVINKNTGSIIHTLTLPRASQPHGVVYDQNRGRVYVSLEARGELISIDKTSRQIVNTLKVALHIKNIAFLPSTQTLYVAQFISDQEFGRFYGVNTSNFTLQHAMTLALDPTPDGQFTGGGLPNYLGAFSLSPDGTQAYIPSKKDNIQRGTYRNGKELTFEHTVRSTSTNIDLMNHTENRAKSADIDNNDFATSVVFNQYGNKILISTSGSSEIWVIDAYTGKLEGSTGSGGLAPRGMAFAGDASKLYVHNFMDRNVTVFNASTCQSDCANLELIKTIETVSTESLDAEVFLGKQLFYNSKDLRLAQDGYMSCASCHIDGSGDGTVWDITSMGEGLRNTIDLRGKRGIGQGRLHWTGNFDEVHDFENQIRELNSGEGLLSDADFEATRDPLGAPKTGLSTDLDALASYLTSLNQFPESPSKSSNGELTISAQNGLAIFRELACNNCHSGAEYTNSSENYLYDVGTSAAGSGDRLGQKLLGFDAPTLKGLWATSPYLHNGAANTLEEVLTTLNQESKHADVSGLSNSEMNDLVAFLNQLDDEAPAAGESALSASIGSVSDGDVYTQGSDVTLELMTTIPQINRVDYYLNGEMISTVEESPFDLTLEDIALGTKELVVKVYYGMHNTAIVTPQITIYAVQPDKFIANGTYYIHSVPTGQAVSIDLDDVLMKEACGSTENQWRINYIGDEQYTLQNIANSGFLSAINTECANRTNLVTTTNPNTDVSKWFIDQSASGYFYFRPVFCQRRAMNNGNGPDKSVLLWDNLPNHLNQSFELITVEQGVTCDDGDACTINDQLDADCNCVGVFADDDQDGICNTDDICPLGDDDLDENNNGTPDACDLLGLNSEDGTEVLSVYPNPATDILVVKLGGYRYADVISYDLLDVSGRELSTGNQSLLDRTSNALKIDVGALNVGMYLLSIKTGETRSMVKFEVE